MGMGIRKYPLPGGDGDGSKVVYPLGLGMGINFYYRDGDEMMIPVPAPSRCHPYKQRIYTHIKSCSRSTDHSNKHLFMGKPQLTAWKVCDATCVAITPRFFLYMF